MTIPTLLAAGLYASTTLLPAQTLQAISLLPPSIRLFLFTNLSTLRSVIKTVVIIDVLRTLNRVFTRLAANNWRYSAQPGWENLSKEVAVVTGGCSGIGQKVVYGLLERGITVIVLDIQEMPSEMLAEAQRITLNTTSPTLSRKQQKLFFYSCDITSPTSLLETHNAILSNPSIPSPPTILVNNAGISIEKPLLLSTPSQINRVFQVNTISHFTLCQLFLPHMIRQNKGHIVTIASLASFVALPYGAAYASSKASALAFHEALMCELKHIHNAKNVMCTIVHPNFVDTPLTAGFQDKLKRGGLRKILTADDVADSVIRKVCVERRGGQVFVPSGAGWVVSFLRCLPGWMQEGVRDAVGRGTGDNFGRISGEELMGRLEKGMGENGNGRVVSSKV